jgi:hypothetical protein
VWWQQAFIAWAGVRVCESFVPNPLPGWTRYALATTAFVLDVHFFPIIAWHTIDGLFLLSLGIVLARTTSRPQQLVGYFAIGAACLCKQGFLLAAAAAIVALGAHRSVRNLVVAVMPGVLYVAWVSAAGGWSDMFVQLTAGHGVLADVAEVYASKYLAIGVGLGIFLHLVIDRWTPLWTRMWARAAVVAPMFVGLIVWIPLDILWGFTTVGMVAVSVALLRGPERRFAAFALFLAVSASISFGYAAPGLAAGVMAIAILAIPLGRSSQAGRAATAPVGALALLAVVAFVEVRSEHQYRDLSVSETTMELGHVLPGGSWIHTNPRTHAFLLDLATITSGLQGRRYAILPDVPGWWAFAPQRNPLVLDWAFEVELGPGEPSLVARALADLDAQRGKIVCIVQRHAADMLSEGFEELPDDYSPLLEHVRQQWTRTGVTEHFELFE